ncbi:MAG: MFS transporter [Bryobacteraceae bacterium]
MSLWRNRDFLKLFSGQAVSELGSRITREGLPLTAVLALAATPSQMGYLAAAGAIPVLLLSLGTGVWVDRVRRRPLMIWADIGRAIVLCAVPLAAFYGTLRLEHLFFITLFSGAFTVLFDVAYQSYLPS